MSTRVAPARESQKTAAVQPPDVHIHIGRIELTAANPPQSARRERPVAAKSTALDNYLQRRGGKKP